jgi:hypothetical protein
MANTETCTAQMAAHSNRLQGLGFTEPTSTGDILGSIFPERRTRMLITDLIKMR